MTAQQMGVITEWTATYDDPIVLSLGEVVVVGRRDTEWPGFVWCVASSGKEGWIPEVLLEFANDPQATATEPYDARELTVKVGTQVRTYQAIAGWTWCEDADGETGWVPDRCLSQGYQVGGAISDRNR